MKELRKKRKKSEKSLFFLLVFALDRGNKIEIQEAIAVFGFNAYAAVGNFLYNTFYTGSKSYCVDLAFLVDKLLC